MQVTPTFQGEVYSKKTVFPVPVTRFAGLIKELTGPKPTDWEVLLSGSVSPERCCSWSGHQRAGVPLFPNTCYKNQGQLWGGLGLPKRQQMGLLAGGVPVKFRHPSCGLGGVGGGKQVSACAASALHF